MNELMAISRRWAWLPWLMSVVLGAQIVLWIADRDPPYKLLSAMPASAAPGQTLQLHMHVWRDPSRRCSLSMFRWISDSRGYRHYLQAVTFTAEGIQRIARESPGEVKISIELPDVIAIGRASYDAEYTYRCNPVHDLWPIVMNVKVPFEVGYQ